MQPTILTAAGRYFDFLAPERSVIGIDEIAHALSNICRFTGHTRDFYSVAEHSVHVSRLVPPGPDRWRFRSRTFEGVADACADQWGGHAAREVAA